MDWTPWCLSRRVTHAWWNTYTGPVTIMLCANLSPSDTSLDWQSGLNPNKVHWNVAMSIFCYTANIQRIHSVSIDVQEIPLECFQKCTKPVTDCTRLTSLVFLQFESIMSGMAVNRKPLEIADPGVCDFLGNCKPLIYCIHIFIMEAQAHHK